VIVHVGTSGWQYRDWRPAFYPPRLPAARWLEAYAGAFATVESNNAFYRLPTASVFAAWADRTPDDFVMAVKVSRFLTHVKRLREPEEPVGRFVGRARHLGRKLGPVLLQLPPQLRADVKLLEATLEAFPADVRVAVEFRHESWFTAETRRVLERHRAALCLADRAGLRGPVWATSDWTYVRLHAGRASPQPCYGHAALEAWAARIHGGAGDWHEAWVYFNNDPNACAVANAIELAHFSARRGLETTRVPPRSAVRVVGGS
jgi:uncharacterized protein YecE (DUF72 family)